MSEWSPPGRRFLPRDPRVEEPYRLTPRQAARIAILAVVAVVLFALLFFRLWALQVISGESHLETARENQVRTSRIQPPRGPILDSGGTVLVSNVPGTVVQLWPAYTDGRLDEVITNLSELLEVPAKEIRRQVKLRANDPLTPIVVKVNVHDAKASYLREHHLEFPGVEVAATQLRRYEQGSLAAHLLGYVGEIAEEELVRLGEGYAGGDRIGKTGIEFAYDTFLRGEPGIAQVRVNSLGEPRGAPEPSQLPKAGYAVRLTIDADLQRAAEEALRYGIQLGRNTGNWAANGGAIVAMDPRDGAILALATNPTYNPQLFAGRLDPKKTADLFNEERAAPLNNPNLNRPLVGVYPAGSTFKPVTALAALETGLITPGDFFQCNAGRVIAGQRFDNWNPHIDEPMELTTALAQSCDTYFYDVGELFYGAEGSPMQKWARLVGFGKLTGIDVGPESEGLVPTPAWRKRYFNDPVSRLWSTGHSVQLAIGQGDLLVTPLQMARFYALLANGGKLVNPYLVKDVEQPAGSSKEAPVVLRSFEPKPPRDLGLRPANIEVVQEGLWDATHQPYGTAVGVFGGWEVSVAGKTGTAEKFLQLPVGYLGLEQPFSNLFDQAWFCGYGPTDSSGALAGDEPLVVCALIENGGHGGEVAAPAAAQVFAAHWDIDPPVISTEVNSD